MTRIPLWSGLHSFERRRRVIRRNPVARALSLEAGRFHQRVIPSKRLYRRHARHRKGSFAPANFGWA